MTVLAAMATGLLAAAATHAVLRPDRTLGARVRPYTARARAALGLRVHPAELEEVTAPAAHREALVQRLLVRDGRRAASLAVRLRQSGAGASTATGEDLVARHRLRQVVDAVATAVAVAAAATVTGATPLSALVLGLLGGAVGAARANGRLERAIDDRRERIRAELTTALLVLALHVRAGGGVVQAASRLTERSTGIVAGDLREALALHRSGRRLGDALAAVARSTPEPQAARLYRLLGSGAEHGSDLASGLLALAADVRSERVEDLRRQATRRRGAALVPIIGVLAPVMLAFVVAPLPRLVLGGL